MNLVVITPPPALADLARAKAHLRVDDDEQDVMISAYAAAASAHIDGPKGWVGRALGYQVLEARYDAVPCGAGDRFKLPLGPALKIVSITHVDEDGVAQTWSGDAYSLEGDDVILNPGWSWPSLRGDAGGFRVRYAAGHVVDINANPVVTATPPPVLVAVLLMIGDMFANRETTVSGTIVSKIPMSTMVESLLSPFRSWRG